MALANVYCKGGSLFVENIFISSLAYEVVEAVDDEGYDLDFSAPWAAGRLKQRQLLELASVGASPGQAAAPPDAAVLLWIGRRLHGGCASCTLRVWPELEPEAASNCEVWSLAASADGSAAARRKATWKPGHTFLVTALVGSARRGAGARKSTSGLPSRRVQQGTLAPREAAARRPAVAQPWERLLNTAFAGTKSGGLALPAVEEPWMEAVFRLVRRCLSPERSGFPIEEVFRRLDGLEASDGSLSRSEFDRLILTYRPELTPQQLERLFAVVNASGSGRIGLSEFRRHFGSAASATSLAVPAASAAVPPEATTLAALAEAPWMQEVLDSVRSCLSFERSGFQIEEVFQRLDGLETSDDSLSRAEFDKLILTYRPELRQEELKQLFAAVNTSGSGRIGLSEFKRRFGPAKASPAAALEEPWMHGIFELIRQCFSYSRTGLTLEEVFRRLDGLDSADNSLSQVEFDKMVLTYRPELGAQQLKQLFSAVNTSRSGRVSWREFEARFGAGGAGAGAGGGAGGAAQVAAIAQPGPVASSSRHLQQQQQDDNVLAGFMTGRPG